MADLFAYLNWRGDLSFSQVPLTPVDSLLLSTLVYVNFEGLVSSDPCGSVPLHAVATAFQALPEAEQDRRVRIRPDKKLLAAMGASPRFRDTRLMMYRSMLLEEVQTQFAAMTYFLEDGTAFVCFRGTDETLVGWKEDFNMSFQESIPAQREALRYTLEYASHNPVLLRLGGHSKGGNLAVYAAAKADPMTQQRIINVFNNDGPGFTGSLMGDEGYLRMVPKIQTFIPSSSIIGMLLEHEEPYRIIRSSLVSVLQHEPYSWEVMGGDFLYEEAMSEHTQFMDQTIKRWVADMSLEERSKLVDTLYELLRSGGAKDVADLLSPKNILATFRTFNTNEQAKKLLTGEFSEFLNAALQTLKKPQ